MILSKLNILQAIQIFFTLKICSEFTETCTFKQILYIAAELKNAAILKYLHQIGLNLVFSCFSPFSRFIYYLIVS